MAILEDYNTVPSLLMLMYNEKLMFLMTMSIEINLNVIICIVPNNTMIGPLSV